MVPPQTRKTLKNRREKLRHQRKNMVFWKRKNQGSMEVKETKIFGGRAPNQKKSEQPEKKQKTRVLQKKGALHHLSPRPWFFGFSGLGPFLMRPLFFFPVFFFFWFFWFGALLHEAPVFLVCLVFSGLSVFFPPFFFWFAS